MKILLLCLLSIPAFCQFPDTTKLERGVALFFPPPTKVSPATYIAPLKLEFQKTIDKYLNTGGEILYLFSSNTGNSAPFTMTRNLINMIPMSADVRAEELVLIDKLIAEVVKPGVYVPPVTTEPPLTLKEVVNDTQVTLSGTWSKATATATLTWPAKFNASNVSYTTAVGSSASYTFTGRRVEVIGELCDNHGKMKVDIVKDGTVIHTAIADMYKNTGGTQNEPCKNNGPSSVFLSSTLSPGTYTAVVSLYAVDLTAVPRRDSFVFDGFKIYE